MESSSTRARIPAFQAGEVGAAPTDSTKLLAWLGALERDWLLRAVAAYKNAPPGTPIRITRLRKLSMPGGGSRP